jgi:hypothetical protein
MAELLLVLICLAASKAKHGGSWNLQVVEEQEVLEKEIRRVERTEKGVLLEVEANLTATFEGLDREGTWLEGDLNDRYWSDRERTVIREQQTRLQALGNSASYGAFEESDGQNCCSGGKCGLYNGKCCFYFLRHVCSAANTTAAITKRYSSLTKSWQQVVELIAGRTMLFIGDSVSHQTYEAAVCDLYRHGFIKETPSPAGDMPQECDDEPDKCANSCQHFVGANGVANGSNSAVTLCFQWMAEFNKTIFVRALANPANPVNVVVFNLGLWYGDSEVPGECAADLLSDLKTAFSLGAEWTARGSDRVMMFRGTSPQHFDGHGPQASGAFDHNQRAGNTRQCTPHDGLRGGGPNAAPVESTSMQLFQPDACVLVALRSLGLNYGSSKRCTKKIYFVPLSKSFDARYDAHMGSGVPETRQGRGADCSHYCFFPRLWDVLWGRLYLALQHHLAFCEQEAQAGS